MAGLRPHTTKRQKEAAANFALIVQRHKDKLHPDDLNFEPRNFANWMLACDTCDDAGLLIYCRTMELTLVRAASGAYVKPGDVYTEMRTPYRDYALAAMKRRFPDHPYNDDRMPF